MSHIWMTGVIHMNDVCHTCSASSVKPSNIRRIWVVAHVFMHTCIHVYIYVYIYTYIYIIWMTHVIHMNDSCHTNKWCVSHIQRVISKAIKHQTHMSRGTRIHAYIYYVYTYLSYEQPMLLIWMTQVTHMKDMCHTMGWLRLVESLKTQVSFAKEPYKRDYILQKRPRFLRSLLIIDTP